MVFYVEFPPFQIQYYYDYQLSKARERLVNRFVLLSPATGSVSSGNLSAIDVNGSKAREIVGDETGDARLTILLPMETR